MSPLRAALLVANKEVRSAFRDRQTRIYTLVMPLVMYPAMFWIALQASALVDALRSARTVVVEVVAEPNAEGRATELALELERVESGPAAVDVPAPEELAAAATPTTDFVQVEPSSSAEAAFQRLATRGGPDAVVWVPADGPLLLVHDASRSASKLALERVERHLDTLVESGREHELGMPVTALAPYTFERRDLAAPEAVGAFLLSTMLPLMLIAMATMGAFFPAVDVTAGEKERRSAETTLLLPIPRSALFTGQLLSVSVASLAATTMNLVGITLAANHLLGMLTDRVQFELPLAKVVMLLPVVLMLAIFLGSVLTACASFTDTFKQGQALLGTVQTIFILPAMASTLPGIELTYAVAAVPVVGASVALRAILRAESFGELPIGPLMVALAVMAVLAVGALLVAVRAMQREPGNTPRWVQKLTGAKKNS